MRFPASSATTFFFAKQIQSFTLTRKRQSCSYCYRGISRGSKSVAARSQSRATCNRKSDVVHVRDQPKVPTDNKVSEAARKEEERQQRSRWPNSNEARSIALRVPPLLLVAYGFFFSSDHPIYGYKYGVTPGGISGCWGPSMAPSILHWDIVLRETISYRLPGMLKRNICVGDIVICVMNADKGFFGCSYVLKRVVATEGMAVDRLGQYAERYGIQPDPNNYEEMVRDENYTREFGSQKMQHARIVTVPEGHFWLEGDNPLYSIDSRHYGPVPVPAIRGRVIARLWPFGKEEDDIPARRSMTYPLIRPEPPKVDELCSGKYGFVMAPQAVR